jgi:hypothetical protein
LVLLLPDVEEPDVPVVAEPLPVEGVDVERAFIISHLLSGPVATVMPRAAGAAALPVGKATRMIGGMAHATARRTPYHRGQEELPCSRKTT